MVTVEEEVGHKDLIGGGQTDLHGHAGGGANVKSGIVTGITEGSQKSVSFGTAFSSIPNVCATVKDTGGNKSSTLCIENITIGGFEISTKGDGCDAYWIATDAAG